MSERELQVPGGDQPPGPPDVDTPEASSVLPGASSPASAEQTAPSSPMPMQPRPRRPRTHFMPYQVAMMNRVFAYDPVPQPETIQGLADRLSLAPEKVTTWFQNRRSKAKKEAKQLRLQQLKQQRSMMSNGPAPPNVTINKFGGPPTSEMNCRLQHAMRFGTFPTPAGLGGPQPYSNASASSQIPPPPGLPPHRSMPGFNQENPSGKVEWAKELSSLVKISNMYSSNNPGQSAVTNHHIPQRPPFDSIGDRPDVVAMQQGVRSNHNSRAALQDISNQYGDQMPRQGVFPSAPETTPHPCPQNKQWDYSRREYHQQNNSLNTRRIDGQIPQCMEPGEHQMMPNHNGLAMFHNSGLMTDNQQMMHDNNPQAMTNDQEMVRNHNTLLDNRHIMHTNQQMTPISPSPRNHQNGYRDIPSTSTSNSLSNFAPSSSHNGFLSTDLNEREAPINFDSIIPGSPSSSDYSLDDPSNTCITHPSFSQLFGINSLEQSNDTATPNNHGNAGAATGDLFTAPGRSHDAALDPGAFYANNGGMSGSNLTDIRMNQRADCNFDTATSTIPKSVCDQLPSTSQGSGRSTLPTTAMNPQVMRFNFETVTDDHCYSAKVPTVTSTSDSMTDGTGGTIPPSTSMLNVMLLADSTRMAGGSDPTVSSASSTQHVAAASNMMNNSGDRNGQWPLPPVVRNQAGDHTPDQSDQLLPYTSFIDHDDVFGEHL